MTRQELLRRAATLADDGTPYVAVTVVEAKGSTPADAGAKMLVTGDGPTSGRLDCGT
ncbi:MAG: XdhC family protein, partial [Planctomycetota bacterium]